MDVSTVILTKNEEQNIGRCLDALTWCDDVLVVDDGSEDRTRELARRCGARVLEHRFESFARQRNWALQNGGLQHRWVLMLDADEVVDAAFVKELAAAVASAAPATAGWMICRQTMLGDKWLKYCDGFPVWITRLVRVGAAQFVDDGHGEKAVAADGFHFGKIDAPVQHFAFSKGIADWVQRHNRYSTREAAAELNAEHRSGRIGDLFSRDGFVRRQALRATRTRMPLRPLLRFVHQYILKRGFLDGRAGLTYSLLMANFEWWIVLKRRELQAPIGGEKHSTNNSRTDDFKQAASLPGMKVEVRETI